MPDPDNGQAADPAESASWGALQIWVNGQNLCAHIDQGEVLQSSHWYLLPIIEWFIENWNPILHEERLPNRNASNTAVAALEETRYPPRLTGEAEAFAWDEERYRWRHRHALRTARNGGLLPNVVIRRLRDTLEISWNDESLAGTPAGFRYSATNGSALLNPEHVANTLYEVIAAAAEYLYEMLPDQKRVIELCTQVKTLRAPQARDTRLEWLTGLRETAPLTGQLQGTMPEQEMHTRWLQIVEALKSTGDTAGALATLKVEESPLVITGSCHASLMFSSVTPTISEHDVRTLASVMVRQYSRKPVTNELANLSEPVALDPSIRPWEQGYDLAESLHTDLNLDLTAGWVDIEKILQRLGVSILARALNDDELRACCIAGEHHTPTIVHNETSRFFSHPAARRFTLAHEFCHILFDQSRGKKLAIASGPWAPKAFEQRANAFAAMFLMPPELVERAIADLPDPVHDVTSISRIADRLHVSRRTIVDHLYNMTLMSETERDALLQLLVDQV